jgi:hypothetical protein
VAILTSSGRAAIAQSIAAQPIHFAWGSGDSTWDTTPQPENADATGLTNELGRRTATSVQFVTPSDTGDIIVPVFNDSDGNTVSKRFALSGDPTPHLYMRFNFDFTDAPASVIREIAIFVSTVVQQGLPAGQMYFTLEELSDPGNLLAIEHLSDSILRSPNSRQSFEFVFTV